MTEYYDPRLHDYDMYCYCGESWRHTVVILNVDGSPKNLTSYTAEMQIRNSKSGELIETPSIYIDSLGGKMLLSIPADRTEKMYTRDARYDLKIKSADGEATYLVKGKFIMVPNKTKD